MTHLASTTPATTTGATNLGDRGASYLRTVIPVLWGSLVAQLLTWLAPHLPGDVGTALGNWLSGDAAIAVVTAATIALWYVLWRKVEPLIPDWLTRFVLGSAAAPVYSKVTTEGVAVVTTLPATASADLPELGEEIDDEFALRDDV